MSLVPPAGLRASRFRHVREFFWPSLGFRRSTLYLVHRVRRLPDSPYSIAAGFACGTAVSFTPLIGLHFGIAAVLAWIMRADLLASALGTLLGNPWTLPFILLWLYHIGHWMIGDTPSRPLPVHLTLRLPLPTTLCGCCCRCRLARSPMTVGRAGS